MAANEYGLDVAYFKKKLGLVVRDADRYTPEEMFNELSKYVMVAANQAGMGVEMKITFPTKSKLIQDGLNNPPYGG